jgi:hypothetical protein
MNGVLQKVTQVSCRLSQASLENSENHTDAEGQRRILAGKWVLS